MSSERRDSSTSATGAAGRDDDGSVITREGDGFHVQPWSFQPHIAHLVIQNQHHAPSVAKVLQWTDRLPGLGYRSVRTNALSRASGRQLESAGYTVLQELVLLEINAPRRALNAARAADEARTAERVGTYRLSSEHATDISAVDVAAFGTNWGLSEGGIRDVCGATPRYRISGAGAPLAAFAVSGRDGRQGFLQRLSVSPAMQRQGLGRALVLDSLEWMTRWRVQHVLVNTAFDNHAALALYKGVGFRRIGERLRVYERSLT